MARSRVRTSQSVSLFPFLAVLVCAMGALILLLIVTTRRIRREAVARAAVVKPQPAEPKDERPQIVAPVPRVEPKLPAMHKPVIVSRETDRIIAAHVASVRRMNTQMESTVRQLQSQRKAAIKEFEDLLAKTDSATQRLRNAKLQLHQLEAAREKLDELSDRDAAALATLESQIKVTAANAERYRRELAILKLQAAQASSKFAIVPFDGRSGTTRRPIFIECTKDSLRILPEDITITAKDLQGFTTSYNPVLAGAQSLVDYWTAKKKRDSIGQEPEPYILLLVRPGGSVAYYAARKLLRELGQPIGYELIEPDWTLAMPAVDPAAKAVCQQAVDRALAQRRRAMEAVLANRRRYGGDGGSESPGGTSFSGSNSPTESGTGSTGTNSRMMRFNRATGRFEVIKPNQEPSLGPFGSTLDDGRDNYPSSSGSTPQYGQPDGGRFPKTTPGGTPTAKAGSPNGAGPFNGSTKTGTGTPGQPGIETPNPMGGTKSANGANQQTKDATGGSSSDHEDDPFKSLTTRSGRPGSLKTPGSPDGTKTTGPFAGSPNGGEQSQSGGTTTSHNSGGSSSDPNAGRTGGSSSLVLGNTGKKSQGGNSNSSSMFTQKRRWGLSDRRAGIGFEREITVWSSAEAIRIGKGRMLAVGKGESREELLRSVISAVDAEARSWGKPPSSFYWVPTLRFVISPGGNQHYDRLKSGLEKVGLPSVAEQRLETTAPPTPTR